MAENKQEFTGFIGPSYQDRSLRYDIQRTENYYLENDESGGGKEGEIAAFIQRPGLLFAQNLGGSGIRCTYTVSNSDVSIIVCGNQVYQVSGALSTPLPIVGNMATTNGFVSMADNGISVFFVDGTNGYYFDIGTFSFTTVVPGSTATPDFYKADMVTYQDGYFIFNSAGTNQYFISDLYSTSFLALNYAAKSGYPDIIVGQISNSRELFVFGTETIEVHADTGASGSTPFVREDGKNSQVGCLSAGTIVQMAGSIFWLGSNPQGGAVIYQMNGYVPERISTHAIETALQSLGDISTSTAYAVQYEGHYWYILNPSGSSTTWVYDAAVQQFTEFRSELTPGTPGRFLGQNHCILNGQHLIGDFSTGNLYILDGNTYTDNGATILRRRTSPHQSKNLNTVFYNLLQIDFQAGQGLVDDGTNPSNAVNPSAMLEVSYDSGNTWSTPDPELLGAIGQFLYRARWQQLGSGYDVVFRVSVSDPVCANIISAKLDTTVGYA